MAARRVLEATGIAFAWDVQNAGAKVLEETGTPLPNERLDSVHTHGVALKGPITTALGTGFRSVNVVIRRSLDLYANIRPARTSTWWCARTPRGSTWASSTRSYRTAWRRRSGSSRARAASASCATPSTTPARKGTSRSSPSTRSVCSRSPTASSCASPARSRRTIPTSPSAT